MKRTILLYGIIGGLLIAALRFAQYRFLVLSHSTEIYAALVAATFAILGIALGGRLTRRPQVLIKEVPVEIPIAVPQPTSAAFVFNEQKRESLGLTRRELEILALVAEGLSNREIAEKIYVSENTVKTHCSRVFDKLGARRRTQAVQLAKEYRLLP